jgi:addiction module HigA family antidote
MASRPTPLHPGKILQDEFLVPLRLSAAALSKACGLPRTRIERIVKRATGVSADTALRLSKALGTSVQVWMNLQNQYDLAIAERKLGDELEKIKPIVDFKGE